MGWISYHVEGQWKNGRYIIDRKAECDRLISQKAHQSQGVWYPKIEVLKSTVIGRVYYAAVKTTNKDGSYKIWAAVFLTSTNQRSYNNFAYKDQDETCGPTDCCCPRSILELLTETDSQYATTWRENCWKYHDLKKNVHI